MSNYCPQCGNLVVAGSQHCTQCGTPLTAAGAPTAVQAVVPPGAVPGPPAVPPGPPPPGAYPVPGAPGGEPPKPGTNTALIVAVAVLATLLVVGIVAVVLTRGGDSDQVTASSSTVAPTSAPSSTTTSTSTTSTSTTTTSTSTTTTTAPPPTSAPTGDVLAQPAGLLCRDLQGRGFSYSAAVDYWRFHGQPNRMDADRNGIPCETVFPRGDVIAYWGAIPEDEYNSTPAGLKCADLEARGFSYAEAVAYWFATGAPDLMDADLNGIPCETVYSGDEIDFYWFG